MRIAVALAAAVALACCAGASAAPPACTTYGTVIAVQLLDQQHRSGADVSFAQLRAGWPRLVGESQRAAAALPAATPAQRLARSRYAALVDSLRRAQLLGTASFWPALAGAAHDADAV